MGSGPPSFFGGVTYTPPDAIFELTKTYNADPDIRKVNLGQGTYKDENGNPWILPAVQAAKEKIKEANHEYLPILGLGSFRTLATELVFGKASSAVQERRVASCQALSGTGALHVAGKMLYKALGRKTTVYITKPSWSNHRQVFESVGFPVQEFVYSSDSTNGVDMSSFLKTLKDAAPKSILVLHASAHNPTGWDPTPEQWKAIGVVVKERQLFPLFDAAYLGMTSGDYDKDAFAIRYFVEELSLEVGVCLSFAKSMGLYGERVGLCAFVSQTSTATEAVESALAQLIRVEISNPPAFGARIVAAVLADEEIRAEWARNLVTMSSRIAEMRWQLYEGLNQLGTPGDWKRITEQKGMFCILGLTPDQVLHLQKEHHIYMAESSRVSIAGLNWSNVKYVADCIDTTIRG
ncbi:putative aspartate aminotransferase [Talaromyces proteolyticus]|uniref:Aspartate aminotransferase n=1 Tax=Talaromyces proteolyticus TaxID=1131652 RepID=A0AAD4L1I9_9EURO|nr:putative aspartate aminotransferase [Talaromyces proteolyticus]KAH8704895.1 putative aspartate aminotransferase [Talaromyces proteolyticus]